MGCWICVSKIKVKLTLRFGRVGETHFLSAKKNEITIFDYQILELMDIQAEKLQLIEWLARLNDTKIIQDIKLLKSTTDVDLFKQYTDQDLIARAGVSMEDI